MKQEKRVAIVTGGAQGIGGAIVRELARGGFLPVIVDINGEKAEAMRRSLEDEGFEALSVRVNVADVAEVKAAVSTVYERYGRIDVLVNNAGILHNTPIEAITEEEWDRIIDVNLKSVFFLSQAVLPHMKAAGYGRIVNMSSLAGRMGGYANGVGYSASKAGVIGLTKAFSRRVAEFGITVNAIAPGTTSSEILSAFTPEKIEALKNGIPVKRLGEPEEIAALAAFLASERAGFITGAVVDINGGMYS